MKGCTLQIRTRQLPRWSFAVQFHACLCRDNEQNLHPAGLQAINCIPCCDIVTKVSDLAFFAPKAELTDYLSTAEGQVFTFTHLFCPVLNHLY